MLIAAIASMMLSGIDSDIILTERPVPLSDGATVFATCTRLKVEIEYRNSWAKGVQALDGEASFSGKAKNIGAALSEIRRTSEAINDVEITCEAENVALVAIDAAGVDGGHFRWVLTVDDRLNVRVSEPEEICDKSGDCN